MSFKFDQMCRTCLSNSETLFSIFDKNVPEMNSTAYAVDFLKNFCKIVISPNNDLPDKVCGICAEEIKRAYAFKIKCERAADTLKKYLDQRTALQTPALIFTNALGAEQIIIGSTITPVTRLGERKTPSQNNEECVIPVKRLKKKVTERRPQAESNGSSQPAADIICIDDDEDVKKRPLFSCDSPAKSEVSTLEQPSIGNNEAAGPIISEISSLKQQSIENNTGNTSSISTDEKLSPNFKTFSIVERIEGARSSGEESPVSVIMVAEEDYFSENATIPSHEINSNDVEVADKFAGSSPLEKNSEPQAISNKVDKMENADQYICHICSDVIRGNDNFVYHISKHKFGAVPNLYEPPPLIMFNKTAVKEKITEKQVEAIDISERELRVCIEDSFVCHICSEAVKGNDKFIQHVQAHTLNEETESETKITVVKCADGFKCGECGEVCDTKRSLILHVRRRHMSTHTCNICTQEFQSFRELYIHRRIHFSENECNLCKRKFPTAYRLKIHKKLSHKDEAANDEQQNAFSLFNCGMCSMSFQTDDELNTHMQTHDNE